METRFKELVKVQESVNNVVLNRLDEQELDHPQGTDFLLAMHVEVFEFFNAIGTWKWWKHNHKLNKEDILDELADVMAFFLSIVLEDANYRRKIDEVIEEIIEHLEDYSSTAIMKSVAAALENGQKQPFIVIMGACITIAQNAVDATWEEIEQAYLHKSEVNIDRQKNNY